MMTLHYPRLKNTRAKFEAGENFGAVVTFPTTTVAKTFLQEINNDVDYLKTGLIAKTNENQLYFTLEFASVLYAYPGVSFDESILQELNEYTGYSAQQSIKTTEKTEKLETTESKMNSNPTSPLQASSKTKSTLFAPSTMTGKDETPFRRENFVYNYYNEEECSAFLGEKLTADDKMLLAYLENGCSYRTLALYLIKTHKQEPGFVQNVINELVHEQNHPSALTPKQVLDAIQLKLDQGPTTI